MTLADPRTGEIVELDTPPTSLVQVDQRCDAIEELRDRYGVDRSDLLGKRGAS